MIYEQDLQVVSVGGAGGGGCGDGGAGGGLGTLPLEMGQQSCLLSNSARVEARLMSSAVSEAMYSCYCQRRW